jgi:hypothetical protein
VLRCLGKYDAGSAPAKTKSRDPSPARLALGDIEPASPLDKAKASTISTFDLGHNVKVSSVIDSRCGPQSLAQDVDDSRMEHIT